MVFFGLAEEMVGAGVCSTEITYDFWYPDRKAFKTFSTLHMENDIYVSSQTSVNYIAMPVAKALGVYPQGNWFFH